MQDLYITSAQPNPFGRDAISPGQATNAKLNEEWVEFTLQRDRNLSGDELSHLTFNWSCHPTGEQSVIRFGSAALRAGHKVRVHTGKGMAGWVGSVWHVYAGRSWFVWNNACGDRATLSFNGQTIDWAQYDPHPPEGVLVRRPGTNKLVPAHAQALRW